MTDSPRPLVPAPERILAVRLDNIGDVLMVGPALRAIRAFAPRAHLALLASPAGASAAALLPEIDEVITLRSLWQDASGQLPFDPERERRVIKRLAAGRFGAAFIFTSFSQTPFAPAYACYLAGIPIRVGQPVDFGGGLLSHTVARAPDGSHQVDRNLNLVEAVGLPVPSRAVRLAIPPAAHESSERLLWASGIDPRMPYLVFAPGATASARRYPAARFADVARGLAEHLRWPIVVLGDGREVEAAGTIAAAVPDAASIAGQTSIAEAAAVIAGARLVVCSHSAPLHIADAVGTPVACLFSGTDRESEWRPRQAPAVLLRQPTACAPCRAFDCPIGLPCLAIEPEAVIDASLSLLAAQARPLDERWMACAS